MKGLIKYSLHDYIRSHKYFIPVAAYIVLVIVQYTYKPNPIIDSYAITAMFLFIISAWITISFLLQDSTVHRQIMILHSGGVSRYYAAKIIAVILITLMLLMFAILYPIVFSMFKESVTITVGLVSIFNHFLLALLGISVAIYFTNVFMKSYVTMYGGLVLTIVLSIAAIGIEQVLPSFLKKLIWLLPPISQIQVALLEWPGLFISQSIVLQFLWMLFYSVTLIFVFIQIVKRYA